MCSTHRGQNKYDWTELIIIHFSLNVTEQSPTRPNQGPRGQNVPLQKARAWHHDAWSSTGSNLIHQNVFKVGPAMKHKIDPSLYSPKAQHFEEVVNVIWICRTLGSGSWISKYPKSESCSLGSQRLFVCPLLFFNGVGHSWVALYWSSGLWNQIN